MSFWYLATPYTKYRLGIERAFIDAACEAALLATAGVSVFSPIVHSHPIAFHGLIDPFDHDLWLRIDRPFMELACGLIVCQLDGWEESKGVAAERDIFQAAGKPIVMMLPGLVPPALKQGFR